MKLNVNNFEPIDLKKVTTHPEPWVIGLDWIYSMLNTPSAEQIKFSEGQKTAALDYLQQALEYILYTGEKPLA